MATDDFSGATNHLTNAKQFVIPKNKLSLKSREPWNTGTGAVSEDMPRKSLYLRCANLSSSKVKVTHL